MRALGPGRRPLGVLALALVATAAAAAPPSPESVLGFRPGEDRQLADWTQIVDYFHRLDAASDRVVFRDAIGALKVRYGLLRIAFQIGCRQEAGRRLGFCDVSHCLDVARQGRGLIEPAARPR